MEAFLVLLGFGIVAAILFGPSFLYTRIVEGRRRRNVDEIKEQNAALVRRVFELEKSVRELKAGGGAVAAPDVRPAAAAAVATPASIAPEREAPKPPIPAPPVMPVAPQQSPVAAPIIPVVPKPPAPPIASPPTRVEPPPTTTSKPPIAPLPAAPAPRPPAPTYASAPVSAPAVVPAKAPAPRPPVAPQKPEAPQKSFGERFEEAIGAKWGPMVAAILLFIGMVAYIQSKWQLIPPLGRVALFFATAAAMLAGGVSLERKKQHYVLGRSLIGAGWATAFFTTYAMYHVPGAKVISSLEVDLLLMVVVAAVMVWHTLKYESQFVTGCAFLLGFFAIAQSSTSVWSVFSGVILAIGLAVIVVRKQWYELEIFGVLASFLNHAWWLRPTIERNQAQFGHNVIFDGYYLSIAIIGIYWATFRTTYVLRRIRNQQDETVSTLAAILSPTLLLGVAYFQSLHQKEVAFWALLALGAVEFTLAQLPRVKARRTAFVTLSTLGACLMIGGVPMRFSGSPRTILWLIGTEAFLLAGIAAKEQLFRRFGMALGAIVAVAAVAESGFPLINALLNGNRALNNASGATFAAIAIALYLNTHLVGRRWQELFAEQFDRSVLIILSWLAALNLVFALYALVPQHWVAVSVAVALTVVSFAAMQLKAPDLTAQAHVLALIAMIDVVLVNGELESRVRVISFLTVAGLLYLSSRFVRLFEAADEGSRLMGATYTWGASALIVALAWFHFQDAWTAVLWAAFALALAIVGRVFHLRHFWLQAHVVAALAVGRTLFYNLQVEGVSTWGTSLRLVTIASTGALLYVAARFTLQHEFTTGDASEKVGLRVSQGYTWAATGLLAALAGFETHDWRTAVIWAAFALSLSACGSLLERNELKWQAMLLSIFAFGAALFFNMRETAMWHGWLSIRLASVAAVAIAIYCLQLWPPRPAVKAIYSWSASTLVTWLIWYQAQPVQVALLWAVFAVVLFEIGMARKSQHLRIQAYVALAASFARIFFVNFNAPQVAGELSARVITVLPIAAILFYVYQRIAGDNDLVLPQARAIRVSTAIAYFGTITLAAIIRFELDPPWIVAGWATLAFVLMAAAWLLKRPVFVHQALLLLIPVAFRTAMFNVNASRSEILSVTSPLLAAAIAAGIFLLALPFAFKLRDREASPGLNALWARPEQAMFFVPAMLIAMLLWTKLPNVFLTLAWGVEAIAIFVFALSVRERSYRLSGLALLVLCVAKVLILDVWNFNEPSARYLTLIGIGAILFAVSFLYGRFSEKFKELL
jgi:hypothetical protein